MKTTLIIVATLCGLFTSCTQNTRAKSFGGTATVKLPPGTKLVSATWKEQELWYLIRPALPGEVPQTLTLHESSSFGMLEGKVVFEESK